MQDRVGAWRREPGIDWIHEPHEPGLEAWGYEHDNGEVSAWLREEPGGTYAIRASSTHTNEMRVAENVRVDSMTAKRLFYEWLRKNSNWSWRERPKWLLDMNNAEMGSDRSPPDDFDF